MNDRGEVLGVVDREGTVTTLLWRVGGTTFLDTDNPAPGLGALNQSRLAVWSEYQKDPWPGRWSLRRWQSGELTRIDPPQEFQHHTMLVRGINERGSVAVEMWRLDAHGPLGNGPHHGFLLEEDRFIPLGTPVPDPADPYGRDVSPYVLVGDINDNGEVAATAWWGCYSSPCKAPVPVTRSYIWRAGKFTRIPVPFEHTAEVIAIDDSGHVLGSADEYRSGLYSRSYAFLWNGAEVLDLTPLERPVDVNNRGDVLSTTQLRRGSRVYALVNLLASGEWDTLTGNRLNNSGQILAQARNKRTGEVGWVLLTPSF